MYQNFGHGQILILGQSSRTKNILNPKINLIIKRRIEHERLILCVYLARKKNPCL